MRYDVATKRFGHDVTAQEANSWRYSMPFFVELAFVATYRHHTCSTSAMEYGNTTITSLPAKLVVRLLKA